MILFLIRPWINLFNSSLDTLIEFQIIRLRHLTRKKPSKTRGLPLKSSEPNPEFSKN